MEQRVRVLFFFLIKNILFLDNNDNDNDNDNDNNNDDEDENDDDSTVLKLIFILHE